MSELFDPDQNDVELSRMDPSGDQQLEEETRRRIPNVAHALLFVAITALLLILFQLVLLLPGHTVTRGKNGGMMIVSPKRLLTSEAATYLLTLLISSWLFAKLWRRDFLTGIEWRWHEARTQLLRLVPLGFALGLCMAAASSYFTPAKDAPVDAMFASTSDAWLITLFGALLAPAFEEICFRGFLVPAFAITYDWLILPRTPEAHARWRSSTRISAAALAFSAVLSSVLFALLHGQQVAFQPAVMAVLFAISVALTMVRIRTRSVASSAVVHGAYNSFVFLVVFFQTGGYRHLERLKH